MDSSGVARRLRAARSSVLAHTLRSMTTSSEAAAARSRRLHTVSNVENNIKLARQRALEQQKRIEELAKPLNAVSEKLAKLDRAQDAVIAASARKVDALRSGLEKKIEKLKADTDAKIAQTKSDTDVQVAQLRDKQRASEEALHIEYAQALVAFAHGGSTSDLATVLGVSQKQARELIASATADLAAAGIAVASDEASADEPTAPAEDGAAPEMASDDVAASPTALAPV